MATTSMVCLSIQTCQGVKLSCDKALGEIVNDGSTFYGTGEGMGALKATYNGIEAVLPVNVGGKR